jgi:hypothetical protein
VIGNKFITISTVGADQKLSQEKKASLTCTGLLN